MSKKRFVAFLDFLGTRAMLNLPEPQRELRIRVRKSVEDELIDIIKENQNRGESADLEFIHKSDSFIILSRDDTGISYATLTWLCKSLIRNSIYKGQILRGAISCGCLESITNSNISSNSALIEAADYSELLDAGGLLLTPSATRTVRSLGLEPLRHNFVETNHEIMKERVPFSDTLIYRFAEGSSNYRSPLLPKLSELNHLAPEEAKHKLLKTIEIIEKNYRLIR